MKFQIQQELGAKPETSKRAKGSNYISGLTEWLVRTRLLVSAEEPSDGRRERVSEKDRAPCAGVLRDTATLGTVPESLNSVPGHSFRGPLFCRFTQDVMTKLAGSVTSVSRCGSTASSG